MLTALLMLQDAGALAEKLAEKQKLRQKAIMDVMSCTGLLQTAHLALAVYRQRRRREETPLPQRLGQEC